MLAFRNSVQTHTIFLDSQSAQGLAVNPVFHKKAKHLALTFLQVREHADSEGEYGTATLIHVRTKNHTADFIKSLTDQDLVVHRERNVGVP